MGCFTWKRGIVCKRLAFRITRGFDASFVVFFFLLNIEHANIILPIVMLPILVGVFELVDRICTDEWRNKN